MPIDHGLALLILIGRVGDLWSTHLVTPNMVLEANPIARRYKRTTFALSLLLCAVPYYDVPLGVMAAVPSLLVSAGNCSRAWMARSLGEHEMEALILRAVRQSSLREALCFIWAAAAFLFLAAVPLWWLAGDDDIAWFFAAGLALYGVVFAVHSSLFFVRAFGQAQATDRKAT